MLCSLAERYRRFRGTCRFHPQSRRMMRYHAVWQRGTNISEESAASIFRAEQTNNNFHQTIKTLELVWLLCNCVKGYAQKPITWLHHISCLNDPHTSFIRISCKQVKLSLCLETKRYGTERVETAPHSLNLSTGGKQLVSSRFWLLYPMVKATIHSDGTGHIQKKAQNFLAFHWMCYWIYQFKKFGNFYYPTKSCSFMTRFLSLPILCGAANKRSLVPCSELATTQGTDDFQPCNMWGSDPYSVRRLPTFTLKMEAAKWWQPSARLHGNVSQEPSLNFYAIQFVF
jgi:hypothetical protein